MNKKSITLKFEGKTIEVKKLPLGKYAELLKAIKQLPEHIPGLSGLTTDEVLKRIPMLIGEAYPDFVGIMTIATPLTEEDLNSDWFGLSEATDTVLAIIEVNDYRAIFEKIKKALARPAEEKPETAKIGSGGQ